MNKKNNLFFKKRKGGFALLFICFFLVLTLNINLVSSFEPNKKDIVYHVYADNYQEIETKYVKFELPKKATHYWIGDGTSDLYEVIVHDFEISGESYVLKLTWNDDRDADDIINIDYEFLNGFLFDHNIRPRSKTLNPETQFRNFDVEVGTLMGYTELYDPAFDKNVFYPIYEWNDFFILDGKIREDFIAIDDIQIDACGNLATADTTYTLNKSISSTGNCIGFLQKNQTLDCNGYNITYGTGGSQSGISGVNVNTVNATVKNCGIYEGASNNTATYAIYLQSSSLNGTVFNNNIIVNSSGSYGIYNLFGDNHTIYDNDILSADFRGITTHTSEYVDIYDNNITTIGTSDRTLHLILADNTNVSNNYISATGAAAYALYVQGGDNNTIENNNMSSISITALIESSDNNITNNFINSTSDKTVQLGTGASRNYLYNNTIYGVGSTGTIFVFAAPDNIFEDNFIFASSTNGIRIQSSANNNEFIRNNVTGSVYDFNFFLTSDNNTIRDCIEDQTDINVALNGGTGEEIINCTSGTENIPAGSVLTKKWYYEQYVEDILGLPVAGANVTIKNSTEDIQASISTNASGYIQKQELIDYINDGGTKYFYSDYNVSTSKLDFTTNISSYNITVLENLFVNMTLEGNDTTPPTVTDLAPASGITVNTTNNTFTANITDNTYLENATLIITSATYDSNHSEIYSNNVSVIFNETVSLPNDLYTWYIYAYDVYGNIGYSVNHTLRVLNLTIPSTFPYVEYHNPTLPVVRVT